MRVMLCVLALVIAGCTTADLGNADLRSQLRLVDAIWRVHPFMLADDRIDGLWQMDAGGRTGYVEIDRARRDLVVTTPMGVQIEFDYVQADYVLQNDYSVDVTLALREPVTGMQGTFSYNLHRRAFMWRFGNTFAAGTLKRVYNRDRLT